MRLTRHIWLVLASDGRALHSSPDSPAAFFTLAEAKRWAYNNCSTPPQIKKLSVPEWWVKP